MCFRGWAEESAAQPFGAYLRGSLRDGERAFRRWPTAGIASPLLYIATNGAIGAMAGFATTIDQALTSAFIGGAIIGGLAIFNVLSGAHARGLERTEAQQLRKATTNPVDGQPMRAAMDTDVPLNPANKSTYYPNQNAAIKAAENAKGGGGVATNAKGTIIVHTDKMGSKLTGGVDKLGAHVHTANRTVNGVTHHYRWVGKVQFGLKAVGRFAVRAARNNIFMLWRNTCCFRRWGKAWA